MVHNDSRPPLPVLVKPSILTDADGRTTALSILFDDRAAGGSHVEVTLSVADMHALGRQIAAFARNAA